VHENVGKTAEIISPPPDFDPLRVVHVEAEVRKPARGAGLGAASSTGPVGRITAAAAGLPTSARSSKRGGHFQSLGAIPFIVPAMGSHGGATAEDNDN